LLDSLLQELQRLDCGVGLKNRRQNEGLEGREGTGASLVGYC